MATVENNFMNSEETYWNYIKLNISGKKYVCLIKDFLPYLDTRLGKLANAIEGQRNDDAAAKYCDRYFEDTQEYYFNRPQDLFDPILDFYRNHNTTIHFLPHYCCCPERFIAELDYWQIDIKYVAACCQTAIPQQLFINQPEHLVIDTSAVFMDEYQNQYCSSTRRRIWNIMSPQNHTHLGKVFSSISIAFVLSTAVLIVLDSLPNFQYYDIETNTTDVDPILNYADGICVGWFTFEYVVRLWACPNLCQFIRAPVSQIDLMSICPFYIEIIVGGTAGFGIFKSLHSLRLLRLLRLLRVLRILKITRYSRGMRVFGNTLLSSWHELFLLLLCMLVACLLFSTMMYYCEKDIPGTMITTIPEAAWWCIISMTTVGYGDIRPIGIAGKFVAGLVCISGVIIMAFPVSIIVKNFHSQYKDECTIKHTQLTSKAQLDFKLKPQKFSDTV